MPRVLVAYLAVILWGCATETPTNQMRTEQPPQTIETQVIERNWPTKLSPLTIPAGSWAPARMDIDEPKEGVEFDCVIEATDQFREASRRIVGPAGVRFLVRIDRATGVGTALKANWWDRHTSDNFEGQTQAIVSLRKDQEGLYSKASNQTLRIQLLEPLTLAYFDLDKYLFEETLAKAKAGDVEAMVNTGTNYEFGLNVRADEDEALKWFKKAAARGSTMGMNAAGEIYAKRKDWEESFQWYSKAADLNDALAIFRLGIMHKQGWHVAKNQEKAVELIEKAAKMGHPAAMHFLAILLSKGEGLPKNELHAYMWAILASAKDAQYAKLRDLLEKRLEPSQVAEGQRLATEWNRDHGSRK